MLPEQALNFLNYTQKFDQLKAQLILYLESNQPLPEILRLLNINYLKTGKWPKAKRPKALERDFKICLCLKLCRNNGYTWADAYEKVGDHFCLSGKAVEKSWSVWKNRVSYYEILHGPIMRSADITNERIEQMAEKLTYSVKDFFNSQK